MSGLDPNENDRVVTKGTLRRLFKRLCKTQSELGWGTISFKAFCREGLKDELKRYRERDYSVEAMKCMDYK